MGGPGTRGLALIPHTYPARSPPGAGPSQLTKLLPNEFRQVVL